MSEEKQKIPYIFPFLSRYLYFLARSVKNELILKLFCVKVWRFCKNALPLQP